MGTITLKNVRATSDLTVKVRLKDGGTAISWPSLSNIKAWLYSDAQKAISGRFEVSVDEGDATILVCHYSAQKPQYLGLNRVIVQATYLEDLKTYDKPAFIFVRWTDEQTQDITIDDPDVDVEIEVQDVSSSILDAAIAAAITAAVRADEAAAAAEHMTDIHQGPPGPAGKSPYIDETTGNWFVWDEQTEQYVDSGNHAQGATGNGIASWTVVESQEDGGSNTVTVTFTDGTSETFTYKNGHTGATPNLTIGTVETGAAGSQAEATITGTAANPVLNLRIPQGVPGVVQAKYVEVDTLPTASASTMNALYLVPSQVQGSYDIYYTSQDGRETYSWVFLCGTTIQLSDYATKAELSQLEQDSTELREDVDYVTEKVVTITDIASMNYDQTAANSQVKAIGATLTAGVTYKLGIKFSGFSSANMGRLSGITLWKDGSTQVGDNLRSADGFGTRDELADGEWHYLTIANSQNVSYVRTQFNSAYAADTPAGKVYFTAVIETENYAKQTEVGNLTDLVTDDKSSIVNAINSITTKEITDFDSQYSQENYDSGYKACLLEKGKTYTLSIQMTGIGEDNKARLKTDGIQLFSSATGSALVDDTLVTAFGGKSEVTSGNVVTCQYTPTEEIRWFKITFNSAYVAEVGNSIHFSGTRREDRYLSAETAGQLYGKKVLMLGDSITQLPRTGGTTTGNGIVEFFAQYTGATTIRGAFGGSHIRARRILESTADITDLSSAKASFDIAYLVTALCDGDWDLQDAAIAWMTANNELDTYWPTILADLKALDMDTVDAVTIFAGTNDYANNVPLGAVDSSDITNENGAWNSILEMLTDTYKHLSVFVFTPIVKKAGGDWCEDVTNTQGLYLSDYAANNLAAAKRFMCYGVDLFYTMSWNRYNFTTFAPDGTHPTKGFDCLGKKMAGCVGSNFNR